MIELATYLDLRIPEPVARRLLSLPAMAWEDMSVGFRAYAGDYR